METHVLLVDDETTLSSNMAAYLGRQGFHLTAVTHASTAREELSKRGFNIMLLDVGLPDTNGLDFLEELREHYPSLPVVIVSGYDTKQNTEKAADLGAVEFLSKPVALSRVRDVIRKTILDGDETAGRKSPVGPGGKPVTIMNYSHDGFGLGHLRRNINIASRFVRDVAGANALLLAGSGAAFDLPDGVDFVNLPAIVKTGTNEWRSRRLRMAPESAKNLRSRLILRTAEIMNPDFFLVDHVPTGVWGELIPTLEMLKQRSNPPKVILGLRDILDAPEVVRRTWLREGIYDAIRRYYDEIFIYGQEQFYDTAHQYGLAGLTNEFRYCGHVFSDEETGSVHKIRDLFKLGREQLLVVTAGGGADAFPMMSVAMEAMRLLPERQCPDAIFITGPLMSSEQYNRLVNQAAGLPVHVIRFVPDMASFLNAADVVITMAGYNTSLECIRLQKKMIVIPRTGPSAEQRIRASRMDELGLAYAMAPDCLAVPDLARAIHELLECDAPQRTLWLTNGVDTVANHIKRLLGLEQGAACDGYRVSAS